MPPGAGGTGRWTRRGREHVFPLPSGGAGAEHAVGRTLCPAEGRVSVRDRRTRQAQQVTGSLQWAASPALASLLQS